MSQLERRRNPYPWSWEIPASMCLVVAGTLTVGAQLGRAVANLLAGAGWHLPRLAQTLTCLPALLAGDAGAGLTGLNHPPAPPPSLWSWIGISDLLLLTAVVFVVWWGMRRWSPRRMRGMASPKEARRLLGLRRLRRVAQVVRPDLHPGSNRR